MDPGPRAPFSFSLSPSLPPLKPPRWPRSPTVPVIKRSLFLSIQDYGVSWTFSPGKVPNPLVSRAGLQAGKPPLREVTNGMSHNLHGKKLTATQVAPSRRGQLVESGVPLSCVSQRRDNRDREAASIGTSMDQDAPHWPLCLVLASRFSISTPSAISDPDDSILCDLDS